MFNADDEQKIRELRLDYKIKWLEGIFKQFVKEGIAEFAIEQKQLEELKNPLLTIDDIAKRFKVCKATVHNWINRGIIVGMKVGKNRYFTEEEVRSALTKYGFNK
jgi:excisionase family DNA binding protein